MHSLFLQWNHPLDLKGSKWPYMDKHFLEFLHIFPFIFIDVYYLLQFHQIHHI